jgi:hypothetical protein
MLRTILKRVVQVQPQQLTQHLVKTQVMRFGYDNYSEDNRNFGDYDEMDQMDIARNFTSNSKGIKTVTIEQIENLVTLDEMRPETKRRLEAEGVTELFNVQ